MDTAQITPQAEQTHPERDYFESLDEIQNYAEPHEYDAATLVPHPDHGAPSRPRRCCDCGRPAYYDMDDDTYRHAENAALGCFLIGADERDDDHEHPLVP